MIIKNLLTPDEIDAIQDAVANCPVADKQEIYGRYLYHQIMWKKENSIHKNVEKKIVELTGKPYWLYGFVVCDYTAEAGKPNLPPHFDGDNTDLIMTYQLSSNRTWGVGVDLNVYDLEDNDGVIFHPNESIHWRPHAKFEDGEFVRVVFFRFRLPVESDYSHLRFSQDDPIFDEVRAFRDSL
jgi:hypothetical protein